MNLTNAERAEVLVHALPYIQKYNNKIVVIKYGRKRHAEQQT